MVDISANIIGGLFLIFGTILGVAIVFFVWGNYMHPTLNLLYNNTQVVNNTLIDLPSTSSNMDNSLYLSLCIIVAGVFLIIVLWTLYEQEWFGFLSGGS